MFSATLSALGSIITGKTTEPPRLLIYGTEGIGKSTWAAQADSCIFIPTERGLNQIDCAKFPLCSSWEQVLEYTETIIREPHDYQFLVYDSADWLEKIIFADVVAKSEKVISNIDDIGYAKGYTQSLQRWNDLIERLEYLHQNRQMGVIFVAHSQIEKFDDPESQSYDRYSPRLQKKTSLPLLCEWCDAVLFAKRKMRTSTVDVGFKKTRTTAAAIGTGGGERVLQCVGSPTAVAKNRYDLPDELPLSWQAVVEASNNWTGK